MPAAHAPWISAIRLGAELTQHNTEVAGHALAAQPQWQREPSRGPTDRDAREYLGTGEDRVSELVSGARCGLDERHGKDDTNQRGHRDRQERRRNVGGQYCPVGAKYHPPGRSPGHQCDEKTPYRPLDRTQPVLPVTFAATERRTHDYVRHCTTQTEELLDPGSTSAQETRLALEVLRFPGKSEADSADRKQPGSPARCGTCTSKPT